MSCRGRKYYIKLGENDVEMHPDFRLFLQTKLANPHYPPEIQAECALVNFTVTEDGLEDQLLNLTVQMERPDLAAKKLELIKQQNEFKIKMKELEDSILYRLSTAEGDITEDRELIEGLENTKVVSNNIAKKQEIATETSKAIEFTSEKYRSVGARGSLLFFLLNSLFKVHSYYIYDLQSFVVIFKRAINLTGEPPEILRGKSEDDAASKGEGETEGAGEDADGGAEEGDQEDNGGVDEEGENDEEKEANEKLINIALGERCKILVDSIQKNVFNYMRRGLMEKDKLMIATLLTLKIGVGNGHLEESQVDCLIRANESTVDIPDTCEEYMTLIQWKRASALEVFQNPFGGIQEKLQDDADAWKAWLEAANPENLPCPGSLKHLSAFHRLLVLRALRPDRLLEAMKTFVIEELGEDYILQKPFDMMSVMKESLKSTPVFFVLFPGVDPTIWVEQAGNALGYSVGQGNLINISMGEGQEEVANKAMQRMTQEGGWLYLQNLHLMEEWTAKFERVFEQLCPNAHDNFRLFMTAEPPVFSFLKNMPDSLMQCSLKIANEAPSDIRSNLRMTWATYNEEMIQASKQPVHMRGCLAVLCFYHSVILGRRRFGQSGWSRPYSFNMGDLKACSDVLASYLEVTDDVPWDDHIMHFRRDYVRWAYHR